MNNPLRTLVTVATLCLPFYVSADSASINYRHQMTEEDSAHADRIKLNYRMDSGLGFEAEMKYRTAGDREDVAYDNMVNNGHEFTVSYNYKINDTFYVATRYRLDMKKLDRDQINSDMPDNIKDDQDTHRLEGWLGYTPASKWAFEYQAIYFKTNYIRYDNKKSDYEQNLIIKYKLTKEWAPFMEVGDVKVSSTSDDRQARWRLGVQYNFM